MRVSRWMCALGGLVLACVASLAQGQAKELRPPSVPLVTCDPYFCIWSPADKLTDKETVHWTGKSHRLHSMVRVDEKVYRLMGAEPADVPALPQKSVQVLPTRTIYTFGNEQVTLTMTFMTAALPDDLDVLSRPVTYVTWEARAADGNEHTVQVYFDASAELAVNTPNQAVECSNVDIAGQKVLRAGSVDQRILGKRGDDLRIDWGYLYVAAGENSVGIATSGVQARKAFVESANGWVLGEVDAGPANEKDASLVFILPGVTAGAQPVSTHLMLAYDDLYSIKYFSKRLRPYWRRKGAEASDLIKSAAVDYAKLADRCKAFDQELMADLTQAGGEKYAQIAALAYRQCLAANKVAADDAGMPMLFPKENFSNGCIATVDVIYPMDPQFLLFSPALAKASVLMLLDYSASPRWKFPFAPHDLGQYPFATGQVYGGGERTEANQMPVEESGNMLILLAAIAKIDGNADFAGKYWPVITKWAEYLKSKGFDPENQLCTDDFAGHLAHNVNLSAKAIVALGAYAQLADTLGKKDEAQAYRKLAEEFAAQWVKMADDGDHYRLAYDKPGSWSQKYNLVWDRLLGLKLFPESVFKKEMAFYRAHQQKFGLPLDSRKTYTKLDWITWTATLTGSREDFEALIDPIYAFLNETPNRVPMSDWYETTNARKVGFQARSVVGGVFIKMLDDQAMWKKWAGKGANVGLNWAPFPTPPQVRAIVPSARERAASWRFTTSKPADDWFKPDFDDSGWKQGAGGFGTGMTPGAIVGTRWNGSDIWLRREIEIPAGANLNAAQLSIHHDEDAEVYINGVLAAKLAGFSTDYEEVEITPAAKQALSSGKNILAVHCHQTTGGQYIDVGIVEMK